MADLTRRALLRRSGVLAGATVAGSLAAVFPSRMAHAATPDAGYGELLPDPAGLLDLPRPVLPSRSPATASTATPPRTSSPAS